MTLRESAEDRPREGDLLGLIRARLMLNKHYANLFTGYFARARIARLARDTQTDGEGPNGRIPRGDRSDEDAMPNVSLTTGGFDLGEITEEEMRANEDLRARATRQRDRAGATPKAGPQPSGDRISAEELAKAMGATLIGKTSKNHP